MDRMPLREFLLQPGFLLLAAMIVGLGGAAILGSQEIRRAGVECADDGGAQVRTYEGFACAAVHPVSAVERGQ